MSEVERVRRDVKEEATKAAKAELEVLHGKLLHSENVARKGDHKDKDKFTIVLSRFVAHKGKPSFAASLMLTLLSTKEEATIYEKEQKMIKRFGDETPLLVLRLRLICRHSMRPLLYNRWPKPGPQILLVNP